MKFLLFFTFLLAYVSGKGQLIQYIPAAPYPVEVPQPDGSVIKLQGMGDEFNHFPVTEDGFTVMKNERGVYEFARLDEDGKLSPSGYRARNLEERTVSEKQFLKGISKYQKTTAPDAVLKSETVGTDLEKVFPSSGTRKVLLLLIKYPDLDNTYSSTQFGNMLNQSNYNGTGSFRDYYYQASDGELSLSVDVFGWYVAKNSYDYYGDDNGDDRARELVAEAIDAAEAAGVDFSQYDNDNDGEVDNLMVVHSGPGAEEGSQTKYIWSHSWSLGFQYDRTYDGVDINDYIIQPETRVYGMVGIGVFCHEFGHALGLPDLYDTDDSNGDSEGLGKWCLMASGSWLNDEKTPAMLSAWARDELGWITPAVISTPGNYLLSPTASGTECYKLTTTVSNEYFLLENRYKTGFDASLPGSGMAIYHINSNKSDNDDETSKLADLEEADGFTHLDDCTNRGDAGDLFPGSSSNTSFNDITTPGAKNYNSSLTGIDIQSIQLDGSLIRFTLGPGVELGPDLTYNSSSNSLSVATNKIDVDLLVKNTGTQGAGSFGVAFYLSADAAVTIGDYLVGTYSISSLSSGSSVSVSFSQDISTVSPDVPDGNYYVGYIIDYENSEDELDEGNNSFVFSTPLVEVVDLPNLTYNSLQNLLTIDGYNISASLQVKNTGDAASEACSIGFYVSSNQSVSTSDYFIGELSQAALSAGGSANHSFSVNAIEAFPTLPEGYYYVGYIIDYKDSGEESDETDNSFVYISGLVDNVLNANLTFIDDQNNLEITASKINIGMKVVNNGEKKSEPARIGFYISEDSDINTSDLLLGYSSVPEISATQTSDVSVSFDIVSFETFLDEGSYYFGYFIDYRNQVEELDESDNDFAFEETYYYCPPDITELDVEICEGSAYDYQGQSYSEGGAYEFVYNSKTGCDSVILLNLTVNPKNNIVFNEVICRGEKFYVGQNEYAESGLYTHSFVNQFGCDSTVTLYLEVIEPVENHFSTSICLGDSVQMGGEFFSKTGTYLRHLTSQWGCDSLVVINLTVDQPSETLLTKTICFGDSVVVGTSVYNRTGIYTKILTNRFGCDSLVTLDLTVNPAYLSVSEKTICQGDTFWVGNEPFFETGAFTTSFSTQLGCDSTIVLNLTVNPVNDTLLEVFLCEGETVQVGNTVYSEAGIYVENLVNRFGCDSTVTLALTINPKHKTVLEEMICEGDSFWVGTSVYKVSGSFTDVLMNRFGCDSTVYLDLTVNPVDTTEISENICEGSGYPFGGTVFTGSGVYEHVFSNRFGCDSLVTLHLNVTPLPAVDLGDDFVMFSSETVILDAGAGFSYWWNSGETTQTISVSKGRGLGLKSHEVTVINESGCSATAKVSITIYDDSAAENQSGLHFTLFPNPSGGVVKLLMKQIVGNYQVQVVGASGNVVYQNEFDSPGEKFVQELNLTHLHTGHYSVRIIAGDHIVAEKLIIVRY